MKVKTLICKLNIYGFKHHPENEARKARIPGGGRPTWVNGQRSCFYHEDFHCLVYLTLLPRIAGIAFYPSAGGPAEAVVSGGKKV